MIVCVCRRVSDRDIRHHAQAGLDFEAIQARLGVSTQCGRCEPCARDMVQRCAAQGQACPSAQFFQAEQALPQPSPLPLPLAA